MSRRVAAPVWPGGVEPCGEGLGPTHPAGVRAGRPASGDGRHPAFNDRALLLFGGPKCYKEPPTAQASKLDLYENL